MICLWSIGFWHLISKLAICFMGLALTCILVIVTVSGPGHSYPVTSSIAVFCSMFNHSSMHPLSTIFALYYYSWSSRHRKIIFCEFLYLQLIRVFCLLMQLGNSHHYFITSLTLGCTPLIVLLNRSVVRLGSLGLLGIYVCTSLITFLL